MPCGRRGVCWFTYAVTRPCRHRPPLTEQLSLDPRSYAFFPHTVVAGIGQSIARLDQCCCELLVLDLRTIQALVLGGIHLVLVLHELHTGIAQGTYHHYHLEHIWVLIPSRIGGGKGQYRPVRGPCDNHIANPITMLIW